MQRMNNLKSILLFCLLMFAICLPVYASSAIPDVLKIGLFFGSGAKAEVSITSNGGMSISAADDNGSAEIVADSGAGSIKVKKGSFYHVKTAEHFATYDEAWIKKEQYKKAGFPAFAAYDNGTFQVWTGAYDSEAKANAISSEILSSLGEKTQVLSPNSKRVLVYLGDTIWVGLQDESKSLQIYPMTGNISIEGTTYRGGVRIVRQEASDMTVINMVNIEQYLYSVVPKEVTPTWNYEVLKAQAVVARTYAVSNLNKYKKYGFNLCNTTASQVYGGIKAEHANAIKAVDETQGQIVTYQGKAAQVFFFASSGGKTESVEYVWGTAFPYLVSVEDKYENPKEASYGRWNVTFTAKQIKDKLAAQGIDIGEITDVVITQTTPAGRPQKTVIQGTTGEKEFGLESIRRALGLYSANFTVSRTGGSKPIASVINGKGEVTTVTLDSGKSVLGASGINSCPATPTVKSGSSVKTMSATGGTGDFVLTGGGWGHGVGMSQWGAKGMADNGFGYKEIIKHYFTGVEIE